ncbi:TonB-dependent receptor [Noviherbaspirillum denitrificans]|uniref:TonB-dependent receptor n=1 Tax=Noviherbaspirillum denitrificans TaxID=1968433 RepID=A0A254T7X7_9BURK|nr:TonB-dependent receptor [Noviherbaspirillum denitrificans]OWW18754.1 hypothetical protein AYR66_04105 [Noviherbaspirillum denitrificans]
MQSKKCTLPVLMTSLLAAYPGQVDAQESSPAAASKVSEVGTISIAGEGEQLGTGLIERDDTPRARSAVSRASAEKERATADPFQLIELLPGVNSSSTDATGLFENVFSSRGFLNNQMGFTIDGVPINDGASTVFSQPFVDPDNLCQVAVTRASSEFDAPNIYAVGGTVNVATCDPLNTAGVRLSQTLGQLNLRKTFVRGDTGMLFGDQFKAYISASESHVDKWKGKGSANRDQFGLGAELNLSPGNRITFTGLHNLQNNDNIRPLTKAQFYQFGRYFDYTETFPGHLTPVKGTAQVETVSNYYGLNRNPARNWLYSFKGSFQLKPDLQLNVEPYYWYSYSTGFSQEAVVSESAFLDKATRTLTGKTDLNGDGDTLDSILVARQTLNTTRRPGVTMRINWQLDNHKITFGYWFERARLRQTNPAVPVNNDGTPVDPWFNTGYILRPDGSPYENTSRLTITTARQPFVQDSMTFLDDRLNVAIGVRAPRYTNDFYNYASEGRAGSGAVTAGTANSFYDYQIQQQFRSVLPSAAVRYWLTPENHVFANIAKNFKPPNNQTYTNSITRGEVLFRAINTIPESSINTDIGFRSHGSNGSFSAIAFRTLYRDRLAAAFDDVASATIFTNVGAVIVKGIELEAGSRPYFGGWSVYGSFAYTESEMKENLKTGATTSLPTSGKEFPNTPHGIAGIRIQYASGPFYAQLQTKYTGKFFSTLVNDESLPGYTVTNLNLGCKLPDAGMLKNQVLRLNISNLFDKIYLASRGNVFNAAANNPTYFAGAPRFVSISYGVSF